MKVRCEYCGQDVEYQKSCPNCAARLPEVDWNKKLAQTLLDANEARQKLVEKPDKETEVELSLSEKIMDGFLDSVFNRIILLATIGLFLYTLWIGP